VRPLGTEHLQADSDARRRRDDALALALTLFGLAVAFVLIGLSDGFYHDDDITHFLFARDAWGDPVALWHWWGRPGYNVSTMFVAHFFGLAGCRAFSALQTAAVAYLAYLIARRIAGAAGLPARAAALAPALVWIQPAAMTLACTTLTETPAALYMAMGIWLYLRGNRVWGCAAWSAMFVTRYETAALAPVLAVAVIYDALRQANWKIAPALRTGWAWGCAAALLWGPLAYVAASAAASLPKEDSILYMFSRSYPTQYGSGRWGHFLVRWLMASGGGVVALAVAGAIRAGRRAWLVTALGLGLVGLHTVIYHYGLFASGGYARFLVPASAPVAALAAAGLAEAWRRGRHAGVEAVFFVLAGAVAVASRYAYLAPKLLSISTLAPAAVVFVLAGSFMVVTRQGRGRHLLARAAAAVAIAVAAAQACGTIRPLTIAASPLNAALAECLRGTSRTRFADNPALTTHVLVAHIRPNSDVVDNPADAMDRWKRARPGTVFFWDSKYGREPGEFDRLGRLYAELELRGGMLTSHWVAGRGAAVFVRLPDRTPSSRLGPPTTDKRGYRRPD